MPYNSTTSRISAPVAIRDLQDAHGTSVNVIAAKNKVGKCLCKMPTINRWSMHKPVSWSHKFRSVIKDTHPTDYAQWWRGKDGNFNINFDWTPIMGETAAPEKIFDGKARFGYVFIDGEAGDVSRLEDYSDYVHDTRYYTPSGSLAPLSVLAASFDGKIDSPNGSGFATFRVATCEQAGSDGNKLLIGYSDLFGMYYVGFCIRVKNDKGTWTYLFYTTDKPVASISAGQTVETDAVTFYKPNDYTLTATIYLKSNVTYFAAGREAEIMPIISIGPLHEGKGYYGNGVAPILFDANEFANTCKSATLSYYGSSPADVGYVEPDIELLSANISEQTSTRTYTVSGIAIRITSNGGGNAGQPYTFYLGNVSICKFKGLQDGSVRMPVGDWSVNEYKGRTGQTFVLPMSSGSVVDGTINDTFTASSENTQTVDSRLTKTTLLVSVSLRCYLNVSGASAGTYRTIGCYKYFDI